NDLIIKILKDNIPENIEKNLCVLYEKVIERHNQNGELPYLKNKTRYYFNRPYKVIFSENIIDELLDSIKDDEIRKTDLKCYGHDIIIDK
ncbi:MAG: hypothetical protein LBB77_01685, partial [Treponema sp.]|nr:hypothetical protein [Treponema sp.]